MNEGINQSDKTGNFPWVQNQNFIQSGVNESIGRFDYAQCCALVSKIKIQVKYFQHKNNNLKTTNIIELINKEQRNEE